MCLVARLQARLDARPVVSNIVLISLGIPLALLAFVVPTMVTHATLKQGLVFNVAYEVIRLTATWLSDLFSSFWYVQTASIAKLEGEGAMTTAGAYTIYGSIGCAAVGAIVMCICIAVAEPLLRALSPAYSDSELLVNVALEATRVMGLFIPARILLSNLSGIMLGQASTNITLLLPAYGFAAGFGLVGALLMIVVFTGSGCEDAQTAANASAYANATDAEIADYHMRQGWGNVTSTLTPIFDQEAWVCDDAKGALVTASWIESAAMWLGSLCLGVVLFRVSRIRGYFREHGANLRAYAHAVGGEGNAEVARQCSTHLLAVTVRSVLNNTRDLVTPLVATRIGIADAAVINFFEAVGAFSYGVPNICAFGVMIIGSRLLGAGRLDDFRRLVNMHVGLAIFFAVAFAAVAVASSEVELDDDFTNEVDKAVFEPLADSVWPVAIALQPFRSLVAVYGPILMACQGYVEWGLTVAVLFVVVYLPLTIAGGVAGDVRLLVWANVAYNVAHISVLMYLVHCRLLPRILKKTHPSAGEGSPRGAAQSHPSETESTPVKATISDKAKVSPLLDA